MTTSVAIDSLEVQQVKQAVSVRFGKEPQVPNDFYALSVAISTSIGQTLNADTLSRIWGYKASYPTVRKTTLDILRAYANACVESDFVHSAVIHADDLATGTLVELAWLPDRVCTIEYLGAYQWRVTSIQNSKLRVGDTFCTAFMLEGYPMYAHHLIQNGQLPMYYVAGQQGGLSHVLKNRQF